VNVDRVDTEDPSNIVVKLARTSAPTQALGEVVLQPNKIIALCGPNGSGKTAYLEGLSK